MVQLSFFFFFFPFSFFPMTNSPPHVPRCSQRKKNQRRPRPPSPPFFVFPPPSSALFPTGNARPVLSPFFSVLLFPFLSCDLNAFFFLSFVAPSTMPLANGIRKVCVSPFFFFFGYFEDKNREFNSGDPPPRFFFLFFLSVSADLVPREFKDKGALTESLFPFFSFFSRDPL